MSFSASEEDGAVYEPVERAELTPQSPSAGPADFDELCMKVIKAGDMTSVIDDKVRDEVRFEVAVAFVYARENPHITGPGRPRANNKKTTVQALWRQTAVQCGFSEKEKPEPQGSKLSKVTKYAKTILTEKWDTIEKPDFKAWRAKEFMSHIECLENLIDGFNPHAYTPEVVSFLRRLAEKCRVASDRAAESREAQGLLPRGDAVVAASAVTHAMAAEVVRAHARSSDPRSQGKRQCLEAAECAGASEPSSSMGAPHAVMGAVVGMGAVMGASSSSLDAVSGIPSSSMDAVVGATPIDGAPLTPAPPPNPLQALPVTPASLMPAELVTAGTGHPWRMQQAQQAQLAQLAQQAQQAQLAQLAQLADAAVRDVADDLFEAFFAWNGDTIGGVERSYRGELEDELEDDSSGDDETGGGDDETGGGSDETGGGSVSGGSLRSLIVDDSEDSEDSEDEGGSGPDFRSLSLAASALDDLSPLKTALKEILK